MNSKTLISIYFFIFIIINANANFIEYQLETKTYEGYYLKEHKRAPLVLIIHDWDGLTEYETLRAKMFSKNGYNVFALDMFGKGIRPIEIKDKKRLTGALYKDRNQMRKLIKKGLEVAKEKGLNIDNAAIVGYCFGGTSVLETARAGEKLKAFISFHGGLTTPPKQNYKNVQGEILIFHGTTDKIVSMQDFANLAIQLEKDNVRHEMLTYSNAPHAFTVFESDRYRKEADQRSWLRLLDYLNTLK